MRKQVVLALAGTAFILGTGAFALASLDNTVGAWHISTAVNAALLAIGASVITAAALYPILRQRAGWLMRAMAIIAQDNIDFLSVIGKLTELRNGETAGHNLRVSLFTLMFAEALQLPPEEVVRAVKGAMLHDVGKLAIPDCILGEPGLLTAEERSEMHKHVRYGLEIISQSIVLKEAAPVVGGHHERYDGQGYPIGLKGEAIPLPARLFALIDVFDALISRRIYKPAISIDEALATMAAERGAHFDPLLFDRFVELVPNFALHLPRDEASLAMLLMERLLPYSEFFLPEVAIQDFFNAGRAPGACQPRQEAAIMPRVTTSGLATTADTKKP